LTPSKTISQRTPGCAINVAIETGEGARAEAVAQQAVAAEAVVQNGDVGGAGLVCRRRANRSVQRSLPFVVEPRPSVIESRGRRSRRRNWPQARRCR